MADEITGISLRAVRELLEKQPTDSKVLDAVSSLLDVALLLSPVYAGPAGASQMLGLFEAKNALVGLGRMAIERFCKARAGDYLDQAARLAAANCLLTYTAYFDALQRRMPDLMTHFELSGEDKRRVADAKRQVDLRHAERELFGSSNSRSFSDLVISVPHPVSSDGGSGTRTALYKVMGKRLLTILSSYDQIWVALSDDERVHIQIVVQQDVPTLADQMYRAELVGLADDFPQFLTWLLLSDQEAKTALLERISAEAAVQSADTRVQFELVGRAVDLGLKDLAGQIDGLRRALAMLSGRPAVQPSATDGRVPEDLHLRYAGMIEQPVIADRSEAPGGPRLTYPTIVDSYVPQAYRLIRYSSGNTRLEQDDAWENRRVADDLGPFLLRYLESAYSTRTPLLILGHPGSGKSLLTQVLAARLAYPAYTTVRVKLRDADPKSDIQRQIEQQIRDDTGENVSWPQFARSLPSPPVVILDGYDELLQATGSTQADYLDRVRDFQERETELRRPVRVIVTSRITLIDKVSVPPGTTILRLEEFDEPRRQAWTKVWNDRNSGYFAQAGVQEFLPPDNPKLTDLASQPLLLLMLAVYDSAANQLRNSPDIDQTRLYHELITRFVRRELEKDAEGFRQLAPDDQEVRVVRELDRLGVAAIGMFNRQALAIRREELNRDLMFFKAERDVSVLGPRPLSQAELLVGSFLFIHESRSRSEDDPDDTSAGPATYEFLHKTFGEFLTADFLLAQMLAQAKTIAELAKNPALGELLPERLARLNPNWFSCLVHTPLHTQPNVLVMLSEWAPQRLAEDTSSRSDLIAAVDRIVLAQLSGLLTATTLPALASQDRDAAYAPQPALGHLAIYTLNLILLRAYLCTDTYILSEPDLGSQLTDCRPWDRLTALWRSWFPPESLAALASRLTATRDGEQITIMPSPSQLATTATTALTTAYNASLALADDLSTASLALHLTSLAKVPNTYIDSLRERVESEAPDLIPIIEFVAARTTRNPVGKLPTLSADYGTDSVRGILYDAAPGYLPPGLEVEYAEIADRLYLSPVSRSTLTLGPSELDEFASLSRYAAEVAVHSRTAGEYRWLPTLVNRLIPREWRMLLSGPAAAPVLRVACRELAGRLDLSSVAKDIDKAVSKDIDILFDIDTATGVAVLAWQGECTALCSRALDRIIRAVEQGSWRLLDIPMELWGELTSLFASAAPEITRHRPAFAALLSQEIIDFDIPSPLIRVEMRINALRIGALDTIANKGGIIDELCHEWLNSRIDPRLFMLFVRYARENADHEAIRDLFLRQNDVRGGTSEFTWKRVFGVPPDQTLETADVEAISMSLTYREAMDLRWALDIALHGQGTVAQRSSPSRRPRKR